MSHFSRISLSLLCLPLVTNILVAMNGSAFDKEITISVPTADKGSIDLRKLTAAVLNKINAPSGFYKAMPEQYMPAQVASYQNNDLMTIVPLALTGKTQEFKNAVLETALNHMLHAYACHCENDVRAMILAAVAGGADANYTGDGKCEVECPLWHAQDDLEYAQLLIEGGATARNCSLGSRSSLLFTARTLAVAKLFIKNGAYVRHGNNGNGDRLVHVAAADSRYEPGLLEFYLHSPQYCPDVNEQNSDDKTALDLLVKQETLSYRSHPEAFERKLVMLLGKGADYHNALSACEPQGIAHKILTTYCLEYLEETARMRNILLDIF